MLYIVFLITLFCLCRVLQHPNILQCLGQCVEAIPFLLVFEYCEMVSCLTKLFFYVFGYV